jgi:hypothetical protein
LVLDFWNCSDSVVAVGFSFYFPEYDNFLADKDIFSKL